MPTYEEMGMASTLVGLVRAIEVLQSEVTNIRAALAELQNGKPAKKAQKSNTYWSRMTAEQRSAEVRRRMKKGKHKITTLANGRMSVAGLRRGTSEYRAVDAHNRRLRALDKQQVNGEAKTA